jgi:hypothetical protein
MKARISIFFIFLSFLCSHLFAQTYQDNLEKYWHYRNRLKEQFMYFSEDASIPGSHIIAENRDTNKYWDPQIRWGDAMWLYGHYIGVLALEYNLLKINGQGTQETLDELNWAFDTYERLDYYAEPCFYNILGNQGQPSLNGFFLRDDVPESCSTFFDNLRIESDYVNACLQNPQGNCNSQDQCYLMLLGLRLVNDLVDDGNIQARTDFIAGLVISSMRWFNPLTMNWVWEIRNPVNLGVPAGGQVLELESYCWAAAEAAGSITGNNEHKGYSSFSKAQFDIVQGLTWQMLQGGIQGLDKFAGYYTMVLSTILNEGGGYGPYIDGNSYDWLCELYELTEAYEGMGPGIGLFPHLAALSEILHGYNGNNHRSASFYEETFLNDAPPCGSYYYVDPNNPGQSRPPWHTLALFCPWHRGPITAFSGDYTMLDYMMLYNAYFLVYHSNALHYTETTTYTCPLLITPPDPVPPHWVYTIAEPKEVEAIANIYAYDQVNEGGGITYKAGESIHFFPGFTAEAGSFLHAEIDPSMLLQPYYMKTSVNPCNGGTFIPLTNKYRASNPVDNVESNNDLNSSFVDLNNKSFNVSEYGSITVKASSHDDFKISDVLIMPYPNPTHGNIYINFPKSLNVVSVEVLDITGRRMHSIDSKQIYNVSLNLSGYASGIYFVKIKTENSEKIIKVSKL